MRGMVGCDMAGFPRLRGGGRSCAKLPGRIFPGRVGHTWGMPLLLLPLLLILLVVIALVLLPLSLWRRYQYGRARRRAVGWVVRLNRWALWVSVPCFLLSAWLGSVWSDDALRDACIGLIAGLVLGWIGLLLTRFEVSGRHLNYTPNRWMALGLTVVVAVRISLGAWWAWQRASGGDAGSSGWQLFVHAGGLWAVGGLLLGYATAYAWGLSRRYSRFSAVGLAAASARSSGEQPRGR